MGGYNEEIINAIPGLSLMQNRIISGVTQQDRMIRDKKKTFDKALLHSYQSASINDIKWNIDECEWNEDECVQALINPNKVKQDYDDKIISIDYAHGFKTGTVFKWTAKNFRDQYNILGITTNPHLDSDKRDLNFPLPDVTYWLIYLQDKTELAYFRGDIRRCSYTIKWNNDEGKLCQTYAAVRGPVETKINLIQKNKNSIDVPNETLNLLIPYSDDNYKFFKRYRRFYLHEDTNICWEVTATDSISMENIIQVAALEYYINETTDDYEEGIPDAKIPPKVDPNPPDEATIQGPTFITPKSKIRYITTIPDKWVVLDNKPVTITKIDDTTVEIEWRPLYEGTFTLQCGSHKKIVVVERLFKETKV